MDWNIVELRLGDETLLLGPPSAMRIFVPGLEETRAIGALPRLLSMPENRFRLRQFLAYGEWGTIVWQAPDSALVSLAEAVIRSSAIRGVLLTPGLPVAMVAMRRAAPLPQRKMAHRVARMSNQQPRDLKELLAIGVEAATAPGALPGTPQIGAPQPPATPSSQAARPSAAVANPTMPGSLALPTAQQLARMSTLDVAALSTRLLDRLPDGMNIDALDLADRFVLTLAFAKGRLGDEAYRLLLDLVSPANVAIFLVTMGVIIVAQGTPAALPLDSLLLAAAIYFGGMAAVIGIRDFIAAMIDMKFAKTLGELRPAADLMATAVAGIGAAALAAILRKVMKDRRVGGGKQETSKGASSPPNSASNQPPARTARSGRGDDGEANGSKQPPQAAKPAPVVPTAAQLASAAKNKIDPKWVNPDGSIKWPPNNGFDGPPARISLAPETVIDRYGSSGGSYSADAGTPFAQRALPGAAADHPPRKYKVLKEIEVDAGPAAPWFDQSGGGMQYKHDRSIQSLIDDGYLEVVN